MHIFVLFYRLYGVDYYVVSDSWISVCIETRYKSQYVLMAAAIIGLAAMGAVLGGMDFGKHMMKVPKKFHILCRLLIYDFLLSLIFNIILAENIIESKHLSYVGLFYMVDILVDSSRFYIMAFVMKALCFALQSAFLLPYMADKFFTYSVTKTDKEKAWENAAVTDMDALYDNINNTQISEE